jgi:hypothetical protein
MVQLDRGCELAIREEFFGAHGASLATKDEESQRIL